MPLEIEQTQTLPPIDTKGDIINQNSQTVPKATTDAAKQPVSDQIDAALQPILLKAGIDGIGNILAKLTKIDEMAFTEEEAQSLLEVWTPLMPKVSPATNAVLVTLIILTGKGAVYYAKRAKSKPGEPVKPSQPDSEPATLPASDSPAVATTTS